MGKTPRALALLAAVLALVFAGAAVATVSNIAEGHGRESTGAFANHVSIARGSVKELEAQAILAVRLGLTTADEMERLMAMCASVSRMLHVLRTSLQARQ